MIEVTDRNGMTHLLHPDGILRVSEAGASSQWHGIRSYIETTLGTTIDCQQSLQEVHSRLKALKDEVKS